MPGNLRREPKAVLFAKHEVVAAGCQKPFLNQTDIHSLTIKKTSCANLDEPR